MKCPFKVGDHIHELRCLPTYGESIEANMAKPPVWELDASKPDATVIELTERGFKYRYDCRVPIGRAAWGTWTEGGECFEAGFPFWQKTE